MQDLGTLGGPDSAAQFVNDHGQVAGISYTSFTPNPSTGIPTIHPFLWDDGMIDLGSFGGTSGGPTALNNRGQVVGNMDLPGDLLVHPVLWDRGVLKDLGTFGGSNGQALWINDAGEVVGEADFPGDQVHDAFLWKHGVMTDLGNLGRTSFGYYINGRSQVVGHSMVNDGGFRAFLWENGGPMIDLNSLVPSGTSLLLTDAYNINDRGEIAGVGLQPGCSNTDCGHAYVLIPCDENHPGECEDYSMIVGPTLQAAAPTPGSAAITKQNGNSPINQYNQLLNRLMQRYHIPGQSAARRN